ncbi:thermopsin family protease [Vulcanisaeta sp. JCM 16159]|uniref:thermopsin family protease n=1 Tax=Vulcanisaeta sp. JCM 16159 TaxID=1295371 RepID=UPI001FB43500|nr:thermopsin family protease [Vulcanisaeta sp. JCM 16159]
MHVNFSIDYNVKLAIGIALAMMVIAPLIIAGSAAAQSILGYEVTEPQPNMFSYINPITTGLTKYPAQSGVNDTTAGMVILLPSYYLPFQYNVSTGQYINIYVWSNQSVTVYLMNNGEYLSFSSGESYNYIGEAGGNVIEKAFYISNGGTYYIVIDNNNQGTAFVLYEITESPSPEGPVFPVGIADYGLAMLQGNLVAYEYSTNMFVGEVTIYNASTVEPNYCPSLENEPGNDWFSVQLNVVMLVQTVNGVNQYYWLQNVLEFNSQGDQFQVLDNVWNDSGSTSVINSALISGNGGVTSSDGSVLYYDWGVEQPESATLPFTIYLVIKTGLSSNGYPWAAFGYSLNGQSTTWYDNVTIKIPSSYVDIVVTPPNPLSSKYVPFNDAELVIAGPWSSECTVANTLGVELVFTLSMVVIWFQYRTCGISACTRLNQYLTHHQYP